MEPSLNPEYLQRINTNTDQGLTICEIQNSISIKSCRICLLEGIIDKDEQMIAPCNCEGTLKYVHQSCLILWLRTKTMKMSKLHTSIPCEICKVSINFLTDNELHCATGKQMKKKIKKQKKIFILLTLSLMTAIVLIGYLIISALIGNLKFFDEGKTEIDYIAIGVVILLQGYLVMGISFWVRRFTVRKKKFILKIKTKVQEESEVKSKN